jgi:AcrR family transcriptional regulator
VAKQAGVGMGAVYRRFPSKEELLRRLAGDGLGRYLAAAKPALARQRSRLLERTATNQPAVDAK